MRSIAEVHFHPSEEGHTMTDRKPKPVRPRLEALVAQPRSAQGAGQGSAGLGAAVGHDGVFGRGAG
jgi:hypothetical protein